MKFKLDECLDVRLVTLFSDGGYDVQTVYQENLSGTPDERIYSVCLEERRTLITQDIIVLRNPSQLLSEAQHLIKIVILKIREEKPQGHLWIVGRNGIRIWPEK